MVTQSNLSHAEVGRGAAAVICCVFQGGWKWPCLVCIEVIFDIEDQFRGDSRCLLLSLLLHSLGLIDHTGFISEFHIRVYYLRMGTEVITRLPCSSKYKRRMMQALSKVATAIRDTLK